MNPLANKNALVLGGTSGIGRAVAQALLAQGANATVASRRRDADCSAGIAVEQVDVQDREGLVALFERVSQKNGRIDYLVNAATGGERAVGPFLTWISTVSRIHLPNYGDM